MRRDERVLVALAALLIASFILVVHPPPIVAGQGVERVRIGVVGIFDNFNPFIATGAASLSVIEKIYEPLITYDARGNIAPALARIERSGESSWIFRIRPGAMWHDGAPVKAEDVAFTLVTITSQANREKLDRYGLSELLSELRVINSSAIELRFSEPSVEALRILSKIYVVPSHVFRGVDPARYGNPEPIGSGPYRFGGWTSRIEVRLGLFDGYGEGVRGPSELRIMAFEDRRSAALAVRRADVELIDGFPFREEELGILMSPGVSILKGAGDTLTMIFFNLEGRFTSSREFRRAIHQALDIEGLVKNASPLAERVSFSLASSKHSEVLEALPREIHIADLEGASRSLDEMGLQRDVEGIRRTSGGEPVLLRIVYVDTAPAHILATGLASVLARLGIGSELRVVDPRAAGPDGLGDYDVAVLEIPYPNSLYALYSDVLSSGGSYNVANYSSGVVEDALATLRIAGSIDESIAIIEEIASRIAEDLPFIPLYASPVFSAYRGDRLARIDPLAPGSTASLMKMRGVGIPRAPLTVTSTTTLFSLTTVRTTQTLTITLQATPSPPAYPEASIVLLLAIGVIGGMILAGIIYYGYRRGRPARISP